MAASLTNSEGKEDETPPCFDIRIGIHTGPVVTGVVGLRKFPYDIWGDSVITAAGMASLGMPNRINISDAACEIVKDRFACTHRGKVAAKISHAFDECCLSCG